MPNAAPPITIKFLTPHRRLFIYEIHQNLPAITAMDVLQDLNYAQALDGVWMPSCDVKQYNQGERSHEGIHVRKIF